EPRAVGAAAGSVPADRRGRGGGAAGAGSRPGAVEGGCGPRGAAPAAAGPRRGRARRLRGGVAAHRGARATVQGWPVDRGAGGAAGEGAGRAGSKRRRAARRRGVPLALSAQRLVVGGQQDVAARAVTLSRSRSIAACVGVGLVLGAAMGCGGSLDAGRNVPHGMLPVDARNPVIIDNDTWENDWSGEHALLLANTGGNRIVGIIASAIPYWTDANFNATGWGKMVAAARASGIKNIPGVTMSTGLPLVRPADGQVDSTVPNNAEGANLILNLSREMSTPSRPLVVICLV